jgi:hypothetical protein
VYNEMQKAEDILGFSAAKITNTITGFWVWVVINFTNGPSNKTIKTNKTENLHAYSSHKSCLALLPSTPIGLLRYKNHVATSASKAPIIPNHQGYSDNMF